jgi:hypothetical protein
MKKLLIVVLVVLGLRSNAQTVIVDSPSLRFRINADIIPNNNGSITATKLNTILNGQLNVTGSLLKKKVDSVWINGSTLYVKINGNTYTYSIASSGLDTITADARYVKAMQFIDSCAALNNRINNVYPKFTHNVIVNLPGGGIGGFNNGDTIPLIGKPYDSLADILAKKCNHPTYTSPAASISASPAFGTYEYGYNLGTVTLSSGFTQNDGGSVTSTTYYKDGSSLGGNTFSVTSLTSTIDCYVTKAYSQGACKNDNCGQTDCTGRITSGSVNSSHSGYSTYFKRYYGFVNSTSPTNSDILALTQDNNGSTAALTLSNVTPSGSQYLAYFTKGTVTSVTVNGIPATGAFTITTYSVTNAQGATTTYSYVYSNNAQTSTLSSVIFN